jgi:hypothetical protein
MNRSTEPQFVGYAAAHRCLVLARDLVDVAARLRAAAAELLEASASSGQPIAAGGVPDRARATAVDIYRGGRGVQTVRPTLGASNAVTRRHDDDGVSVIDRTFDDANDELRAVAHWGAWKPSKPRARSTRR